MRRQQTLLQSAKRYKSGQGLHYQSLRFCLQSLNFLHRGELKKKKGKEGREDKGGAACCISIPPAERLSVCLWQQPREGDTLCILTQLVYLSLCHCLSLTLSVSACLSLAVSVCYISASTLPLPVTVFLHSGQFFFLRSLLASPYHSISTLSSLCLSGLPANFLSRPPLPSLLTLFSFETSRAPQTVSPRNHTLRAWAKPNRFEPWWPRGVSWSHAPYHDDVGSNVSETTVLSISNVAWINTYADKQATWRVFAQTPYHSPFHLIRSSH